MTINGLYPLYRADNLRALNRIILEDEFDDVAKANYVGCVFSGNYLDFLRRNVDGLHNLGTQLGVLDIGCGSGASFELIPEITAALDANPSRADTARNEAKRLGRSVDIRVGASECLPFSPASMSVVLYLHGFFQARSDYEAIMEINRVLAVGGRFIFDLPHLGRTNLEFGRIFEPRAYIRVLRDFGFELVERRTIDNWDEAICVEKVEDFDYRRMKKLQLVETENGLFQVRNLNDQDYTLR